MGLNAFAGNLILNRHYQQQTQAITPPVWVGGEGGLKTTAPDSPSILGCAQFPVMLAIAFSLFTHC